MTGRVDQVDQEVGTVGLLTLDVLGVLAIGKSGVQGDGSGLDRNTTYFKSAYGHRAIFLLGCRLG